MTIALKRPNGDLIWLDAVITYNRQYRSNITRHPIEDGSTITDHVFTENPRFSVSGIISNADFNTTRPNINSDDADAFGLSAKLIYNSKPVSNSKTQTDSAGRQYQTVGGEPVIGNGESNLLKYLPDSITQFTGTIPPNVTVPNSQRPDWVFEVEDILTEMERNHELITVLEFDAITDRIIRDKPNCYICDLDIGENPETGAAFEVSLQIEQVKFVTLKEEALSPDVVKKLNKKAAKNANKGGVSGTQGSGPADLPGKQKETDLAPLKGFSENGVSKTLEKLKGLFK